MAIDYDGTITLASSVTDIDRTIKWFADTLGFEEIFPLILEDPTTSQGH